MALSATVAFACFLGGCSVDGWKRQSADSRSSAAAPTEVAAKPRAQNSDASRTSYYEDVARNVSYEDPSESPTSASRYQPLNARTIREPTTADLRPIGLNEAIQTALVNSRMIRLDAEFLSNRNSLLNNPSQSPSIYDVDIVNNGVTFGQRGEQAARADFAPRLTTSMLWARDENVQNNGFQSGIPPGSTFYQESGDWNSRIEKVFENGTTAALRFDADYALNNTPRQQRLFGSTYRGTAAAELRVPTMRGAGEEVNRIIGTGSRSALQFNGINQGIVIARINTGISSVQLETDVRNQIFDVQQVYWDLYLAFQQFEVQQDIANALEQIWKQVQARQRQGLERGSAAEEAQAADNYYGARATARQSLATVYETEGRLRRLLGLPVDDGRLLKPIDEPVNADFMVNWEDQVATALGNRIELRRQQMEIHSLQLQLLASKNLLKPQADFVASYRVNGFGDRLFDRNDDDGITDNGLSALNRTLGQNDHTGWNLGIEVAMTLGTRAERAQIRQLEWRLLKARTALAEQEREIQYELQNALTRLQRWQTDMKLAQQRRDAATRRVAATDAEYEAGRTSLDLRLRARVSSGEARVALVRALSEYNKAIANFYYRNGTMLARSGVRVQGAIQPRFYEALGLKDEVSTSAIIPQHEQGGESFHTKADRSNEEVIFELQEGQPPAPPAHPSANQRPASLVPRLEADITLPDEAPNFVETSHQLHLPKPKQLPKLPVLSEESELIP